MNDLRNASSSNEFLRQLVEDMEKNPPHDANQGHDKLMHDLAALILEANSYEFHDFKNGKYATPKVELRNKLLQLSENVVEGRYDN